MKKVFKLILVFGILLNLFSITVSAESINLYNQVVKDSENYIDEENLTNSSENASSEAEELSYANVSTLSSVAQANLSLNNILCIILIAIGILLILLAIAILIKLSSN